MVRIGKNGVEVQEDHRYYDPESQIFRKGKQTLHVNDIPKMLGNKKMSREEWINKMTKQGWSREYLNAWLKDKDDEFAKEYPQSNKTSPKATHTAERPKDPYQLITGRTRPLPAKEALKPIIRGLAKYVKWTMEFDDKILANKKITNWLKSHIPGGVDDKIIDFVTNTATWSDRKIEELMQKIIDYTNRKEKENAK